MSAGELAGLLALPPGSDPFGDEAVIVVDGAPGDVALGTLPAVVVGIDVVVDDAPGIDRIAAAVEANPGAAVALAVLLRTSRALDVGDALAAESAAYALLQGSAEHQRWLAAQPGREPKADPGPPVAVRQDGRTLHITLDRPHARNAFSSAMHAALTDALAPASLDPALEVVIDGNGPAFCSGGDLAEFGVVPDAATAHRLRLRRSAGAAIAAVADRVTVRVHGTCVGAGVELPAFARHVVAASDATFRLPEVAMGLVPGAGGTVSLPRRIGPSRTMLLALTGDAVDAETALAWGLVDALE